MVNPREKWNVRAKPDCLVGAEFTTRYSRSTYGLSGLGTLDQGLDIKTVEIITILNNLLNCTSEIINNLGSKVLIMTVWTH